MKIVKLIKWVVVLIVIAGFGFVGYKWYFADEANDITMQNAVITNLSPMARLCALDIVEDVPVKGSIGTKHLFAKATLNGTITFNLDSVVPAVSGDTLIVTLPAERVDIYESTEDGSYQVFDVWNDKFLGSTNLTTAEENKIKAKVKDNFKATIYNKGYVKRARKEATENLTNMLSGITGKIVIVNDPTPNGNIN